MSTLNTSNITVPSVATMLQHLTDSNPHPQYMRTADVAQYLKNNVYLSDLADVHINNALPSKSLIMWNGMGSWVNVPAEELLLEISGAYATTSTAGFVSLCTTENVLDITNSTAAVTPTTLNAWASAKNLVSSGNFYTTLSAIVADSTVVFPLNLERLQNVNIVNPIVGQTLTLRSYNPMTGETVWANSTIAVAHANTTGFGSVKIASIEECLSGTASSFEQMEASGHLVPSLGAWASLMGTRNVSRVVGSTSTVYQSIIGTGVAGEGTTGTGVTTIINAGGFVADHVVTGTGVLSAVSGNIYGVTMSAGTLRASKGTTVLNAKMGGGSLIADGATITNTIVSGAAATLNLSSGASLTAFTTSGTVTCNAGAMAAHGKIESQGSAVISSGARMYDIAIASAGKLVISSGAYAEGITVQSGGSCVLIQSASAQNILLYPGAKLEVANGAKAHGVVKYGTCDVVQNQGAIIDYLTNKESDRLVYSNAGGSNIDNNIVFFTAAQHPTGVRKAIIGEGGTVTHTFVPMAAMTRVPNSVDPELNDYQIDVAGTTMQEDITSGRTNIQWYVTF